MATGKYIHANANEETGKFEDLLIKENTVEGVDGVLTLHNNNLITTACAINQNLKDVRDLNEKILTLPTTETLPEIVASAVDTKLAEDAKETVYYNYVTIGSGYAIKGLYTSNTSKSLDGVFKAINRIADGALPVATYTVNRLKAILSLDNGDLQGYSNKIKYHIVKEDYSVGTSKVGTFAKKCDLSFNWLINGFNGVIKGMGESICGILKNHNTKIEETNSKIDEFIETSNLNDQYHLQLLDGMLGRYNTETEQREGGILWDYHNDIVELQNTVKKLNNKLDTMASLNDVRVVYEKIDSIIQQLETIEKSSNDVNAIQEKELAKLKADVEDTIKSLNENTFNDVSNIDNLNKLIDTIDDHLSEGVERDKANKKQLQGLLDALQNKVGVNKAILDDVDRRSLYNSELITTKIKDKIPVALSIFSTVVAILASIVAFVK